MNGAEIDTSEVRLHKFTDKGLATKTAKRWPTCWCCVTASKTTGAFAWSAITLQVLGLGHGAVATGRPLVLLSARVMRNCMPIWLCNSSAVTDSLRTPIQYSKEPTMNTPTIDKTDEIAALNVQPYEVVRFNALKHGILSRYTVLSHESHADYESLVNSLMDEHLPAGATEQHLIEELAGVIWRKRRVLQA